MDKHPEALRLADLLERGWLENVDRDAVDVAMIQEELRRLHEVNQELVEALEYHQEQTRPIQRTIDVLAKATGEQA